MTTARRRRLAGLAALAVAGLTASCSGNSPSALDPEGPSAQRIANVWWLMFGLAILVYVVVGGLIIAAATRGKRLEGKDGSSRITDAGFIWIGGVIAPVVILGGLAVVTVSTTNKLVEPQPDPLKIEVIGYRWWWEVRYPEEDVVTANEIHIPAGRPIEIGLETKDVIHSFWVPQLAGKVDQIPGQRNVLRLKADRAGTYRGFCAEFCGIQHAKMQFLVIADEPADFDRWVARRQRPAATPPDEKAALGQVVFNRNTCGSCHTVKGTEARGTAGPDLSDFASRRTIGAVSLPNDRKHLEEWIVDPQSSKPGNLMPPSHLEEDEVGPLLDYLESLE